MLQGFWQNFTHNFTSRRCFFDFGFIEDYGCVGAGFRSY